MDDELVKGDRTMSRSTIAVGIVAAIVVVGALVAIVQPSWIPGAAAKGEIIVDPLVDEETGKPIGRVNGGYPRVILDGVDRGYVTDYGEFLVSDVEPGTHELILVIPYYGELRKFITIEPGETEEVHTEVNMPNPEFIVGVKAGAHLELFNEYGLIRISLTNVGDMDSSNTTAIVLVYTEDNPATPIAVKVFDFPSLVPKSRGGATWTEPAGEPWKCDEYVWGPKEIVCVVVVDEWPFTPQNKTVVQEVTIPSGLFDQVASSVANYLAEHPEKIVGTIAQVVVAWFG